MYLLFSKHLHALADFANIHAAFVRIYFTYFRTLQASYTRQVEQPLVECVSDAEYFSKCNYFARKVVSGNDVYRYNIYIIDACFQGLCVVFFSSS